VVDHYHHEEQLQNAANGLRWPQGYAANHFWPPVFPQKNDQTYWISSTKSAQNPPSGWVMFKMEYTSQFS
jgi:hypothetical protein